MVIINDIYTFLNEIAPVRYQMDLITPAFWSVTAALW